MHCLAAFLRMWHKLISDIWHVFKSALCYAAFVQNPTRSLVNITIIFVVRRFVTSAVGTALFFE
jgi:hypothetical protein